MKRALLTEFSAHSLATAQVARIVKSAGVARGTFYKYFPDLVDAYQWLLKTVMVDLNIHSTEFMHGQTADYLEAIRQLMVRIHQSDYRPFIKMFYGANEGLLAMQSSAHYPVPGITGTQWAVMVLCHQAIKECLLSPDQQDVVLDRLQEALNNIIGG